MNNDGNDGNDGKNGVDDKQHLGHLISHFFHFVCTGTLVEIGFTFQKVLKGIGTGMPPAEVSNKEGDWEKEKEEEVLLS